MTCFNTLLDFANTHLIITNVSFDYIFVVFGCIIIT